MNLKGKMGTTEYAENTENEEVVKSWKLILQVRSLPSLNLLPSVCSGYSVVSNSGSRVKCRAVTESVPEADFFPLNC